jgi:hypothetical protein
MTKAPLKQIYSVAEIAALMGLSPQATLRRLKRAGIVGGRGRGAKLDVPLVALQEILPREWPSVGLVQRLATRWPKSRTSLSVSSPLQ